MASVQIGTKAVGSIVKIKVNNTLRNFIVVHQGRPSTMYDASCNGTWLLMQDIFETRQWHNSNDNRYASSDIRSYLNSTFYNQIDANIRNQIIQAKIPYGAGNSTDTVYSGSNGLSTRVFLLSCYEVGYTKENVNQYICGDGARLSFFLEGGNVTGSDPCLKRIAYLNGTATYWWLRSPYTNNSTGAWCVNTSGRANDYGTSYTWGVRPAFILPSSLLVSDDGSVTTNTPPTTPGAFTLPATINGGSTITISWGASSDAEGNLAGYKVERSTNGGSSWTQIYQSSGTSCTDTITFGWQTVQYRVKAYDSEGEESGWRVSDQRDVFNNTAPTTPSSITVPITPVGGEPLTISWGASSDAEGNLAGYRLERNVDSAGFNQIYEGNTLSFQDTIAKGWKTVQYQVRAYDTANAASAYATSPVRTVDNNTAPVIACDQSGDLGEKSNGFSITYSVSDPDGDAVTVTEAMDGVTKRTFAATAGTNNSFAVTGDYFMELLNGQHTMTITATDTGSKSTVLTLTFTKTVHTLRITLEEPMTTDELITKTVLNVARSIPADAEFTVLVTNNALDTEPAWEDATVSIAAGRNYLFENTTVQNGHAYSFIITAKRGPSGEGGHISSIGGAFE